MNFSKASVVLFTTALSLMSATVPTQVSADELQVAYKTFYSHVRKLNSQDTDALQFGFGFMNIHTQTLCEINSARISTQKQQIPIVVTPEYRFTLPAEKALSLADAMVVLDLTQASNICDISVQLETKPEFVKSRYTKQELHFLYEQYVSFFDDIGGFMSFMMPKVNGLTIQFSDKNLSAIVSNNIEINKGLLLIKAEDFDALTELTLPQKPLRITATTSK